MADRPRHARRWLAALIAGLAAAALGLPASAQLGASATTGKGSRNAPIIFQADEVQYEDQLALVIAKGHVEIVQNGNTLLADEVTYNERTDTIAASGHVSLSSPGGEILFGDYMELRDQMNNDFATNIRMLLADRSRLAANTARRTNGNFTQLVRAVYSPCDLCKRDPTAPPVWQLKASEIDHDKALKLIEFYNATMEIDGWPVFYTPYVSAPDPTVKRASGFLMPSVGSSSTLGAHVTIPYYWVLGPDKDLTLVPRFTTEAGQVLGAQYRERFGNGEIDASGSINNNSNVGSGTATNTGSEVRGNINAHGIFDLDPTYRSGFDIERVSDQTYLLRFGFGNPFLNTEISRAYLQGFEARASTDVDAYLYEPLLPGIGDSTQPIVLPVINRDWQSEPDQFGGRWNLNANLLDIVREVGTQTRRLSLGSAWERSFTDGIGGQYQFLASVRSDGYSVSSLSLLSNPDLPAAYFSQGPEQAAPPIPSDYFAGRVFPQLGLTWRYPVVHPGPAMTGLVEPIVATFVGPSGGNRHDIPDEDSLAFDFNDSDLFRPDRLPGYDVLDTGQRVDYGTKLGIYLNGGGSYWLLVGQSYRAENNPFFPTGSGAEDRFSDVVGRVVLSPSSYLDLIYRFRLSKSDLANRSQEIGVITGPQNLRVSAKYLLLPAETESNVATAALTTSGQNVIFGRREQVIFDVTAKLTRYWSLHGSETLNLTNTSDIVNGVVVPQSGGTSVYGTIQAIYQDECIAFIGSVTQSGVRSGDVTPGWSVLFSVVFKNIGEIGGTIASIAGNAPPP
jgi:LPS-assembly protein